MFGSDVKVPTSKTIQFPHVPGAGGPASCQFRFEKELQKKWLYY
jgi:hypothetical protein